MIRNLLKPLWHFYRRNRLHRSHPYIFNSEVSDLSGLDPTAKIRDSNLSGKIIVGRRCILDNCRISADGPVRIGDHSILSGPVGIVARMNFVEIGKFCSLGPYVSLWESSLHDYTRLTSYSLFTEFFGDLRKDVISKGPIRIGNDVWLGTHATILSGVTIGDGCVIGAGSVVCQDVPPYTIAAGVPAVPIKQRFPEELIRQLCVVKWWDWTEEQILQRRELFGHKLTVERMKEFIPANRGG